MLKTCTQCLTEKPEAEFAKNGKNGFHTACKQCARDKAKAWRLSNPQLAAARDKAKHERNRASRLAQMQRYGKENAERRRAIERNRYALEADRIKERNNAYRKANIALVQVWNNARRATEKRATPSWTDKKLMSEFYAKAAEMTSATGEPHHVDHIIPLRGKEVCGLHVQHNLQVIRAVDNLKKGARFDNTEY